MSSMLLRRSAAGGCMFVLFAVSACGGRDELDFPPLEAGGSAGAAGSTGKGGSVAVGGGSTGGFAGSVVTGGFGGSTGGFAGSIVTGGFGGSIVGGSAGAAGVGGMPTENCSNSIDDDFDGAIDCQDSDCSGYMCAPAAPSGGWQGPIALWEGGAGAAAPACSQSGGYPDLAADAMDELSFDPAECADCICSTPQGLVCNVATIGFYYSSSSCGGTFTTADIVGGACRRYVFSEVDPVGLRWEDAPALGGACLPDTDGTSLFPPLEWGHVVRACGDADAGAGCDSGAACVPRPAAPFNTNLCIYRSGDVACPQGPYFDRQVLFQDANDSRRCTDCSCAAPSGATCTGTLTATTDRLCSEDVQILNQESQCVALSPDPTLPPQVGFVSSRSFRYDPAGPVGGSCQASGGVSTGTATAADPVTFCCL